MLLKFEPHKTHKEHIRKKPYMVKKAAALKQSPIRLLLKIKLLYQLFFKMS